MSEPKPLPRQIKIVNENGYAPSTKIYDAQTAEEITGVMALAIIMDCNTGPEPGVIRAILLYDDEEIRTEYFAAVHANVPVVDWRPVVLENEIRNPTGNTRIPAHYLERVSALPDEPEAIP